MSARARGAQEIRTHSAVLNSSTHSNERHVLQFQLAALELERTRRNREKQAALRRIRDIDRMLLEIEEIMSRNQELLGFRGPVAGAPGERAPAAREEEGEAAALKRRVLRY
jgi:hypothetical protein